MSKSKAALQKSKKKKGGKKKAVDAFAKKEWYVVKVPTYMPTKDRYRIGFTPAKKGGAKKQLDSRTFVMNLADLSNLALEKDKQVDSYYKFDADTKNFKFITEEIMGKQLLTQWHGMEVTRNHRSSLIRKWHTMIECFADVKTTDNYVLRVKALAFTKRRLDQVKKNTYAKNTQVKQIRALMREVIRKHMGEVSLERVVEKLRVGTIGGDIQRRCQLVYPLKNCLIEKVKVLRKPKRDVARLMKIHDLSAEFDPIDEKEEAELAAAEAGEDGADGDENAGDGDAEMTAA